MSARLAKTLDGIAHGVPSESAALLTRSVKRYKALLLTLRANSLCYREQNCFMGEVLYGKNFNAAGQRITDAQSP